MAKEMVVSANPHETRVAILEDGQLCEIYVEREKEFALVGSIYKGRVTRVLPGMQSSFVDIGLDSDAFLYVSDFLQEVEDLDHDADDRAAKTFRPASAQEDSVVSPAPAQVIALPGETIGTAGHEPVSDENRQPQSNESANSNNSSNRPFSRESRPRGDRGSFPRRGGRDRDRGRGPHGRHGRGGRDRAPGGSGRYGRELPQSKYASHRPYEPPEESSGESFEPVLLPGESLSSAKRSGTEQLEAAPTIDQSKFASPTVPEVGQTGEEDHANSNLDFDATSASNPEAGDSRPAHAASPNEAVESPSSRQPRFQRDSRSHESSRNRDDRGYGRSERRGKYRRETDTPSGWITNLEPLPGESLAKARIEETAEPVSHSPIDSSSAQTDRAETDMLDRADEAESCAEPSTVFAPEEQPSQPDVYAHPPADLSEDEAAALAEHVAEAQQEEAERDAEERAEAAAESLPYSEEPESYSADAETQEDAQHAAGADEFDEDESTREESEEGSPSSQDAIHEDEFHEPERVSLEEAEAAAASIEGLAANPQDQMMAGSEGESFSAPSFDPADLRRGLRCLLPQPRLPPEKLSPARGIRLRESRPARRGCLLRSLHELIHPRRISPRQLRPMCDPIFGRVCNARCAAAEGIADGVAAGLSIGMRIIAASRGEIS